jgi:hypothetical protein
MTAPAVPPTRAFHPRVLRLNAGDPANERGAPGRICTANSRVLSSLPLLLGHGSVVISEFKLKEPLWTSPGPRHTAASHPRCYT